MNPVEGTQAKEIKQENNVINKSRFMDQIRQFIQQVAHSKTLTLKNLHNGLKIIFKDRKDSIKQLQSITEQIFSMNFKQLQAKLHQFGFSTNKRRTNKNDLLKICMRFYQPLLLENQKAQIEDQSSSSCNQEEQIADDFPKDEEIQQIMKSKEEKMKGFAKPNVILSKAKSDGMVGVFDKKRNFDDNSLEFKLFQQDLFSTPLAINPKSMSSHKQSDDQQKQQSRERSNLFKENYEKCSKLIDSTMIQILTVHRNKKIGEKADELLGKVIEIYDILSDNIENVNEIVMQYEGKGSEKKEGKINSPGFKPLNESMK